MSQISYVDRGQPNAALTNLGALVHENFRGRVKPWLDVIAPMLALFKKVGPGEYALNGKKLVFAADALYAGMAMATTGYLPASQYVDPITLETTPARTYVRRAVDNFTVARATGKDGAFEDFMSRIMSQMWEALERMQIRHIHGSTAATVCVANEAGGDTTLVVRDGYGWTGANPGMFIEPGMWVSILDANDNYAELGVYTVSSVDYDTSSTTATITFTGATSATVEAGDVLVFSTSTATGDSWHETERNNAPLGLIDIVDPGDTASTYLGVTEASYPRINPIRRASSDWGEVEFMEFIQEISSKSNSQVTSESHTVTMHPGVYIELAKTLLPYTQIQQKGKELPGGWTTVRMGGFDIVQDSYHLPDVVYFLPMEDLKVVDLDGEPSVWDGDGSQFARLADYDGKEWFAKHYLQRFADRRNRIGALTSVTNPNKERYVPTP